MQLPAAVEVAAYRIAGRPDEHRAARRRNRATVRVSLDGALHLEISDNGIGLPVAYRAGVGIRSMRERAAELGGHISIEPANSRHTDPSHHPLGVVVSLEQTRTPSGRRSRS
jgi:two-component system NarL family sensor kinase